VKLSKIFGVIATAGILATVSVPGSFAGHVYAAQVSLHYGDKGTDVIQLQQLLNKLGFPSGTPNGVFGSTTQAAVKKFQIAHHVTSDGIVGPITWLLLNPSSTTATAPVQSSTTHVMAKKSITLDGSLIESPMGFVYDNTTYIPIYYVMQTLDHLQVHSTWDNTTWKMTVPSSTTVDLQSIQLGPEKQAISLNGNVVEHLKGMQYPDPYSHVMTEFMPIWYVMNTLDRIGVKSTWNGSQWTLVDTHAFTAFDKSGTQLGMYPTLQSAESSLKNYPAGVVKNAQGSVLYTQPVPSPFSSFTKADTLVGGYNDVGTAENAISSMPGAVVKDVNGNVVFTESDFGAFTNPQAKVQEFTTLAAATQSISGSQLGYVVDLNSHLVAQLPALYYYLDLNGNWVDSQMGPVGSIPAFAQVGSVYVSTSTNAYASNQTYYLLSKNGGQYVDQLMSNTPTPPQENPFRTIDLRFPSPSSVTGSALDGWLASNNSPLQGLGSAMVAAQNTYGVNATYLMAHAIIESGWGRSSISEDKNNLFGYGAYDSNPGIDAGLFPSEEYAIAFQAWEVRTNYLTPGAGFYYQSPTLDGMNKHYATDVNWSASIAAVMTQFTSQTNGNSSNYVQAASGSTPPTPSSFQEPVFYLNGAQGTVNSSVYSHTLPVYADWATGASQMFNRTLQSGDFGMDVLGMQEVLNRNGAGLTTDSDFGPASQQALKNYQASHNLAVTGICDYNTWLSMYPLPSQILQTGSNLVIDKSIQGMSGGVVTEWFHVTSGTTSGWVDSQYVTLKNVYRLMASSGYSVNVYKTSSLTGTPEFILHTGGFVVSNSSSPSNGVLTVELANQQTGQPMIGYVSASSASLSGI